MIKASEEELNTITNDLNNFLTRSPGTLDRQEEQSSGESQLSLENSWKFYQ